MHAEPRNSIRQEIDAIGERVKREVNFEYLEYGRRQAALRNCRDNLRLVLEERFGTLPDEVIREIEDTPELHRLKLALAWALRVQAATDVGLLHDEWREHLYRGRERGAWENGRDDLVCVLRARFGEVPDSVRRRIETAGTEQLRTWLRKAVRAASLDELGW